MTLYTSDGNLVLKSLDEGRALVRYAKMRVTFSEEPEAISWRQYEAIAEAIANNKSFVIFEDGRLLSMARISEVKPCEKVALSAKAKALRLEASNSDGEDVERLSKSQIAELRRKTFAKIARNKKMQDEPARKMPDFAR